MAQSNGKYLYSLSYTTADSTKSQKFVVSAPLVSTSAFSEIMIATYDR